MPISRIVIAVPNTTVVLLARLVDRSEKGSCLLIACDLLVAFRWDVCVRFFERPSFVRVTSPNNDTALTQEWFEVMGRVTRHMQW
jgi:hypothetical protein